MNKRIDKLIALLDSHHLDAYLVAQDVNIRYLTKFPSSESWLLVSKKKCLYITDFRYVLEARKGLKGIDVIQYQKSIFESVADLAKKLKLRNIGFDATRMSVAEFEKFKKIIPQKGFLKPVNHLVEELRMIKEKEEVAGIRKAIDLNLKAYEFIKKQINPGLSENQLLGKLENYVKSSKALFSFSPIIASGPNSCFPHAKVTDRKIRRNEPLLIDMGIDINGYKSDLTRMFFLGKIAPRVYEVCLEVENAQRSAIARVQENITAAEIDQQARKYLQKKQLARYFGHSLGHGVGLEIHEDPRISQTNLTKLKAGMIFTVEPAVYIPNAFGIRLEDMVLVTRTGCEILTRKENQKDYFFLN